MSAASVPGITRLGGYPAAVPVHHEKTGGLGNYMGVGAIVLWIILFTFIWILIVSFAPNWCCHDHDRECDDGPRVNYARAAMYAFIISLIILVIIGALYSASGNSQC